MSKNDFILEVNPREDVGKGASRRLRRLSGQIPAIIYGAGKEPTPITVAHKDILHATGNEAFFSHVITLKLGKTEESVIIKDLQRHPAKPYILHADFQRVSADQAIHVNVPLHFINETKCVGVKQGGGVINHLLTDLEVSCLPKDLPEFIEVDVANLDVGESLHISDLSLPADVSSVSLSHGESGDLAVVQVTLVRAAVEPAEGEEAAEEPEAKPAAPKAGEEEEQED